MARKTDTCLRDMTKNSLFSHFKAVFMSYCPQFWGTRATWMARKTPCMFDRSDQKLVVFEFGDRFWRSREIYNDHKIRYMFVSYKEKLIVFSFYSCFHELLPTVLGYNDD